MTGLIFTSVESMNRRGAKGNFYLEKDGFHAPQTVSAFLARGKLAEYTVVIVDEAGQIGSKQMLELLELIHENTGRALPLRSSGLAIQSEAGQKGIEFFDVVIGKQVARALPRQW